MVAAFAPASQRLAGTGDSVLVAAAAEDGSVVMCGKVSHIARYRAMLCSYAHINNGSYSMCRCFVRKSS